MTNRFDRRHCLRGLAASAAGLSLPGLSAAADNDIVIGQSVHLTGPAAASFVPVLEGQRLAIEEFNRKGGVGGRQVRLITLDDAYDPKKCVENVRTLIDKDNVVALFGLGSTANVAAVLPVLQEKQVPLIGVYTGAPNLRTKHHPYFFTTMSSYRDEVAKMMENLVALQRTRVGVAVINNAFGEQMSPIIQEVAKEQGVTIVSTGAVDLNGGNAATVAKTIGDAKPQAVIAMLFGPCFVPFVRASKSYIGAPIYAVSIANSKAAIEALGDDSRGLAFTRTLPNALRPISALTRDYAAVMAKAGKKVDFDHFFGYLNIRVLLEGLRRAGKGLTSQSLVTTMERMGKVDLGGYTVTYGPTNHHGSKFVEMAVLGPNGKYIW